MYFRKVYWRIANAGYLENAVFKSSFLRLFLDWFRRQKLDEMLVFPLKAELDRDGYLSKPRSEHHKSQGRKPLSRGALYTVLKNPVYIGKVHHKGKLHDGKHAAIVNKILWDDVQSTLGRNRNNKAARAQGHGHCHARRGVQVHMSLRGKREGLTASTIPAGPELGVGVISRAQFHPDNTFSR